MSDISTSIQAYKDMCEAWDLPEALMGGTRAMRKKGTIYLPQEAKETDAAYLVRLERSVLHNQFKHAVHSLRGKVFSNPIQIGDSASEVVEEWSENIDLEGNNLTAFCFDVFEKGIVYGGSYILVDFPVNTAQTLADERALNLRPFFKHIPAASIIGWKIEHVGGKRRLMQVRIKETITVDDGPYGIEEIEQIRLLEPGYWAVFRQAKDDWVLAIDKNGNLMEGGIPFDDIPLIPFYTNREADMVVAPPLDDLAWLNSAHWQSSSDQRNILHIARVPLLYGKGWIKEDADNVQIGSARMIMNGDPNAALSYVEISGGSIAAGRQDLKDLEDAMTLVSMEPLMPRTGNPTATARALDEAKGNCALQSWSLNLQNTLNEAFEFAGRWINQDIIANVAVNTDFGLTLEESENIKTLYATRQGGDLSQQTFWEELKRRNVLSDEFDAEREQALIAEEGSGGG